MLLKFYAELDTSVDYRNIITLTGQKSSQARIILLANPGWLPTNQRSKTRDKVIQH